MRTQSGSEAREEELAALADGSLAPERHAAVEALAASSPELTARLEEQRRAVSLLQGAAAEAEAPSGLRYRVEQQRSPATRRRYWAGGLALAGAAAAIALVVVLVLPSNVPGGPSVAEAALVGKLPSTARAPGHASPTLLAQAVDGVSFPDWAKKFGWKATGVRTDTIGGRDATTVFYEKGDKRIAYTIVAGDALEHPADASVTRVGPTDFRLLDVGGRRVVTWERLGRTCILSGDLDDAKLVKLAAWNGKGTVGF